MSIIQQCTLWNKPLLPLVLFVYFDANAQDLYLQQYFYNIVLVLFLWSTVELPNVYMCDFVVESSVNGGG